MPDFLLELLSEEIPARMQDKAGDDLARLFAAELARAGLAAETIETYATPRRLALIARGLPAETAAVREETKGPRASAPPQALEGFLRKTGLSRDQLEERDGVLFAVVDKPGRATAAVLAEAVPALVRGFPWPKSMRWGEESASTDSPRWVRPLQNIVALFGEEIVGFEIAGVKSGAATVGHRFHHPGPITLGGAGDYVEKLKACHVVVDPAERRRLIADGAAALAEQAGLTLVEDEALVAENAGLTEWPVPLLGRFDPAFLRVPREAIQLTMRTNQKYFALTDGEGRLAPHFICTANIEATDGGASIVAGNERVLSARLSDAKFFWEQDLKVSLEDRAKKLGNIVFHEKLGTVADKVDRVAKLARWLVEEGIVVDRRADSSNPSRGATPVTPAKAGVHADSSSGTASPWMPASAGMTKEELAGLAETAARLCKADLVTSMVGEFPELQGIIGGHLARAQGEPDEIADAVRDHYKPVGQGDEVPTAPVTVAVSLADKLDTLVGFFGIEETPTGSRDPFALRRAALSVIQLLATNGLRLALVDALGKSWWDTELDVTLAAAGIPQEVRYRLRAADRKAIGFQPLEDQEDHVLISINDEQLLVRANASRMFPLPSFDQVSTFGPKLLAFFADRLKVQQREAGVRHDLIDAVFELGGEDDLVRLLARVRALQAFVETPEGADLLAGYKRAANILRKEGWSGTGKDRRPGLDPGSTLPSRAAQSESCIPDQVRQDDAATPEQDANKKLEHPRQREEAALIAALDSAEPHARAAVESEDFEGAMAALASLRGPVDSFFDKVTVNDPDPAKREARLALLARMRDAVHQVADFSRIEG